MTHLNEPDDLKYLYMNSYAHINAFLYLHAQTCIKIFLIDRIKRHIEKKESALNKLNEQEHSNAPL